MTDNEAPNIIIPTEHQSAPKEHWMVDEMRKVAEEIDTGTFKPKLADDDYFYYGPEQLIAKHPRIQEAMDRFRQEVSTAQNSQEAIEKGQMLHEINENLQRADQWDGQGRWIGKENEEMRMGELLEPIAFMKRLWSVIGENRVQINRFAVEGRVALLVDDPEAKHADLCAVPHALEYDSLIKNIGARSRAENFKQLMTTLETKLAAAEHAHHAPLPELEGKVQVATLQWPVGTEWMVMRINEYGVPTSAKYLGWRTALLSMITLGVITEDEAHKAFPVKPNAASLWYRAQLYHRRNGGKADA
jgi:hypothetical protein